MARRVIPEGANPACKLHLREFVMQSSRPYFARYSVTVHRQAIRPAAQCHDSLRGVRRTIKRAL
jgi:hypothetical protein